MSLEDLDDRPGVERGLEDHPIFVAEAPRERLDRARRAADAEISPRLSVLREGADLEEPLVDVEAVIHAHSPVGEPRRRLGKNDTYLFALAAQPTESRREAK